MVTKQVRSRNSALQTCERATAALLLVVLLVLPLLAVKPAAAQTFTVLHKFSGQGGGIEPPGGVIVDAAGSLYGVTQFGGSFNFGTVFKLDSAGREAVLHNFAAVEGLWPEAPLISGPDGTIYGTTYDGGSAEGGQCKHGCGTVFKRDKSGKQTALYAFTGGSDGGNPDSALVQDAAGNLYGTAYAGGSFAGYCYYFGGCGVVYKLTPSGKETALYAFTDGEDGAFPGNGVVDNAGNLYGTIYRGGASDNGYIYRLDTKGNLTTLYSFTGGSDSGDPKGVFFIDAAGNLYGTTYGVNTADYGIVFKLDSRRKLSVLYTFTGGADGQYPGTLIMDKAGNLYGTTLGGGNGSGCYYDSCGMVFKLDTSGKKTTLHSFTGTDGELPNGLTMDGAGDFYGTTLGGGEGTACSYYHGCGTVFKISP
jgi:uncharacterized repeat protein (TIGR03803 family)